MAPPDAPPTVTSSPHIRDGEDAVARLTEHGRPHPQPREDRRILPVFVDLLLFEDVLVDHVVVEHLNRWFIEINVVRGQDYNIRVAGANGQTNYYDLAVRNLPKLDMTVENRKVASYRARVSLSFKYER